MCTRPTRLTPYKLRQVKKLILGVNPMFDVVLVESSDTKPMKILKISSATNYTFWKMAAIATDQ